MKKIFARVPALLLCYFIPAIYNTAGVIDGHNTSLYNPVARDVLLPAALVLLTLSIDLKGVIKLGPKLLLVFCAGTAGIMLGAIVSFQLMKLIHPETVAGDTWAGMAALAGSWIGGGANMVAMREVFGTDATTFGQFAVVDVACASLWMAILLFRPTARSRSTPATGRYPRHRRDEGTDQRLRGTERAHSQHDRPDGDRRRGSGWRRPGPRHRRAAVGLVQGQYQLGQPVQPDSQFVWVILLSTAMGRA